LKDAFTAVGCYTINPKGTITDGKEGSKEIKG